MTDTSPQVQISGSSYGSVDQLSASGVFAIGADYANLIANGSNAFSTSGSTTLDLAAGELSMASPAQIGRVVQGVTVTAQMVQTNQSLLDAIGVYCRDNGINIVVEVQLTNPPPADWTYQWLEPAVTADLPIVAVENNTELDYPSPGVIASFPSLAANAVLIVRQIVTHYPNVKIGQWVGGGPTNTAAAWWNAYDAAASAAGLPNISYAVADTSWNAPWVTPPATWQATLTSLSALVQADGMSLNVLLDGIPTDGSGQQWTAQSEQHAAMLAAMADVKVAALRIESWSPAYPTATLPVNKPTTMGNDAAEIGAIYPLYQAGSITAAGPIAITASSQQIVTENAVVPIDGLSLGWSAPDAAGSTWAAIVIIDNTGQLSATASGAATVSGAGTNRLILNGNSVELAAELSTVRVIEPVSGPDTVDIEAFGANGRLADRQIQLLSVQSPAGSGTGTIDVPPVSPLQNWTSASATIADGMIVSLSYTWITSSHGAATSGSVMTNSVSIHEPLTESGVASIDGVLQDSSANPVAGSSSSLPLTTNMFNPSAYNPAGDVIAITILSSVEMFGKNGGLDTITYNLASSDPVATVTGVSLTNYFATGGSQTIQYNTGDNPEWLSAWGVQLGSVTTTYDSSGAVIEQLFQGGTTNQYYSLDNVYDPYTGKVWEQIITGPPPQPLNTFVTGPEYITQFNTGDNPNWDWNDWGANTQVTVTRQDYYVTSVSTAPISAAIQDASWGLGVGTVSQSVVPQNPTPNLATPTDDFDGGQTSSILFNNTESGSFLYWKMSGGGYQASIPIAGATSDWTYVGTGDFVGNGTSDILFQNKQSGLLLDWQLQGGSFSKSVPIAGATSDWTCLGTGDFNGDGCSDILFQNSRSGLLLDWQMHDGAFEKAVPIGVSTPDWQYLGTGDFNGDGTSDILFRNKNSGLLLYWTMKDGAYSNSVPIAAATSDWRFLGTGNLDGNGISDILFQNVNSGLLLDWRLENGTFGNAAPIAGATADWKYVGNGDYTGGGAADILFENTRSGQLLYWETKNGGFLNSISIAGASAGWKVLSG